MLVSSSEKEPKNVSFESLALEKHRVGSFPFARDYLASRNLFFRIGRLQSERDERAARNTLESLEYLARSYILLHCQSKILENHLPHVPVTEEFQPRLVPLERSQKKNLFLEEAKQDEFLRYFELLGIRRVSESGISRVELGIFHPTQPERGIGKIHLEIETSDPMKMGCLKVKIMNTKGEEFPLRAQDVPLFFNTSQNYLWNGIQSGMDGIQNEIRIEGGMFSFCQFAIYFHEEEHYQFLKQNSDVARSVQNTYQKIGIHSKIGALLQFEGGEEHLKELFQQLPVPEADFRQALSCVTLAEVGQIYTEEVRASTGALRELEKLLHFFDLDEEATPLLEKASRFFAESLSSYLEGFSSLIGIDYSHLSSWIPEAGE